jgi:E3 ubiquitin-protein ligase HERC1
LNAHFVEEIAVGAEHALVLTSGGDVWGWGNNSDGQLGLGHTAIVREPQLVTTLSGKGVKQVSNVWCPVPALRYYCLVITTAHRYHL